MSVGTSAGGDVKLLGDGNRWGWRIHFQRHSSLSCLVTGLRLLSWHFRCLEASMLSLQHGDLRVALGSKSKLSSYKGESGMVVFDELVLESQGGNR